MALYKFSIDLSQNLKPEPSPIKTLSDIINGQAQQSLNRDVSIVNERRIFRSFINAKRKIQKITNGRAACTSNLGLEG